MARAVTPTTRPLRSCRIGPVTAVRSSSLAPAFCAARANVSSKSSRLRTSPYEGYSARSGQRSSSRWPPPMMRSPTLCAQPLAGLVSMPISMSCLTARGVSPSPHTFSRGNAVFSRSSTSSPA